MNLLKNLLKNLMYLFMYANSIIGVPIINNECCVTYSYGSRMEKINIELNNNLINCISPNETILGYNYEVYNTSCKDVDLVNGRNTNQI